MIVFEFDCQYLCVSRDEGEEVVEIVRDAAGDPPADLHLLSVAHLRFELPMVGDVIHQHQDAGRVPRRSQQDSGRGQVATSTANLHLDEISIDCRRLFANLAPKGG